MLDYAVFPQQRQELIKQRLLKKGRVVCTELAIELQVSEHTIRRDLQELSQQGICKKVYGGAVLLLSPDKNFGERKTVNAREKHLIIKKSQQFIQQESCIFLDTSTTNLLLAQSLPSTFKGTIVTNAPEIAVALSSLSYCEVILLGGMVHPKIGGCIGATAIQQMQDIIFDQAFLGGCAMDPEVGLTSFDFAESEFKKYVIQQSNQVILLLTADKIPRVARYVVAQSDEINVIVTQHKLPLELYQQFRDCGVHIVSTDNE